MHTVHNARIKSARHCVEQRRPGLHRGRLRRSCRCTGQLPSGGRTLVTVAWIGLGVGIHLCAATGAREPAPTVTWDQVVIWLIVPAIVAIVIGGGGVWLSRRIP